MPSERSALVFRLRLDAPLAAPLLVGALGLAGLGWWLAHRGIEETDNAQLEAHLVEIASRVSGTIDRVAVEENQTVRAGDLLVALDPRDAQVRVAQAEADLAEARRQALALQVQTRASLSGAEASADQAQADRQVAEAELERTSADLRRVASLVDQGGISRQELDRARAAYHQAQAQLTRSKASAMQAQASRSQVAVDRSKAAAAEARIRQAQAGLAEARLQLSYLRILAPGTGRIGSLTAEPGRQVQPGQPLMSLVDPHPWVEANFKETQVGGLRPGQDTEVQLDAFPGLTLHGRVISVAPATGSRFALLPPDNATGNFTKVVQRLTARIALDAVPPELDGRLVPGLSATVRVRHR